MSSRRKKSTAKKPKPDRPEREPRHRDEGALRERAQSKLRIAVHLCTIVVLVGLGLFAHRGTLGYAMFGVDSFPQIIASRIQGFSDLIDTYRESLTDGVISAEFFRPTQNLTLALDYAIWRLEPRGYHLTTWLTYGACIALFYATTRKLLGPQAWFGPLLAAAFFALHPCLMDIVPVPAHRPELLVVALLLLALFVLPVGERKRFWLRATAAGVFVWLASGAKEIGVVGCGLVFLHQLLFAREERVVRRFSGAIIASIPAVLGAGIYLANRSVVVGGIGGYLEDPLAQYPALLSKAWSQLLVAGLCPWWFVNDWTRPQLARASVAILALLIVLLLAVNVTSKNPARRNVAGLIVVGLAWLLPAIGVLGLSDKYRVWYALVPVGGLAFILAGLGQGAALLIRERRAWRILGGLSTAGLAFVMFLALYASPLHTNYAQWREATPMLNAILRDLGRKIERSEPGDRISHQYVLRYGGPFPQDRPYMARVPMLLSFSVQSWVDLRYPEKNVRVITGQSEPGYAEIRLYLKHVRRYAPRVPAQGRRTQ
jgi:hypothetical protein